MSTLHFYLTQYFNLFMFRVCPQDHCFVQLQVFNGVFIFPSLLENRNGCCILPSLLANTCFSVTAWAQSVLALRQACCSLIPLAKSMHGGSSSFLSGEAERSRSIRCCRRWHWHGQLGDIRPAFKRWVSSVGSGAT